MSLRLFVALDIDEPARDLADAIEARCRKLELPARYEAREKRHVTVAFLGATPDEQLEAVAAAIARAAATCEPFTLRLDKVGAFPDERRPRIIWLGSTAAAPAFSACATAVRGALGDLGFTFDKPAVAHVTICRLKGFALRMPELPVRRAANIRVRDVVLYQSLPAGRTTRYEERLRAALGRP